LVSGPDSLELGAHLVLQLDELTDEVGECGRLCRRHLVVVLWMCCFVAELVQLISSVPKGLVQIAASFMCFRAGLR
jgi:hypothetical protein